MQVWPKSPRNCMGQLPGMTVIPFSRQRRTASGETLVIDAATDLSRRGRVPSILCIQTRGTPAWTHCSTSSWAMAGRVTITIPSGFSGSEATPG